MGSCLFEAGIANESHLVLLSMIGKKYTDLTSLSVRHPLPSLSIIQAPFFCHLHNQKSSLSKLNHLNLVSRISKEVKDTRTLTTLTAKKSLRTTKTLTIVSKSLATCWNSALLGFSYTGLYSGLRSFICPL